MTAAPVLYDKVTSGHRLSHPPPGDEVVITGISGYFPDSDSVKHLQENLFNKVDLVSGDSRRWEPAHPEIPQRTGKINNINKFDASFFGVDFKQAHAMDPMCRMLLEKSYEAVIDAGQNPKELRGTKTGVFIGKCYVESEKTWIYENMPFNGFGVTGCCSAMLANRISYWLGVTGPSYAIDSACSSSLYALEHAFKAIRDGHCDSAIVGASNLCLNPYLSLQYSRLGALSVDGRCKSFDNSANGFARSEAVVVCLLQKAKDSRRAYAQVLHAKTNCDGYKEQGITYPAGNIQKLLLNEFYKECSIPPKIIEYVEAHGTGTKVGDPEELLAIDQVFCADRLEPLMIGSIKSNMGHSEPASGLCSIAKLCIAYETGYIPPNLHYTTPREGVAALAENRFKVVTGKQPWNRGMSGINNFGFGGANAHILLKNIAKQKINNGIPSDDLPRLVCASGRTESAVAKILDDLESRTVDAELVRLLHAIHDEDISGHVYRGYILLKSTPTKSVSLVRDIQFFSGVKRPVWFVYSGMGSQWASMATQLMRIPIFSAAISKCHEALESKGVNLIKIVTELDPTIYDNILNSCIGNVAIQIGLTDILKAIGIEPDFIIGHSEGELGCAYADGCFSTEQMILSAYSRGLASIETSFIKGSMAVVGLGYAQIKTMIPSEIEVAYHNGPDSSTISGPADVIKSFVAKLEVQGILAEEVPCSNIAYHSKYISKAVTKLLQYLREVILQPRPRSKRWLSTSVPQVLWKDPWATLSSAEYHTNNFLSPVLFEETARLIPGNAIVIEIAPHGLLQPILRRSLKKEVVNIPLVERNNDDSVQYLLTALGKLYEAGLNPHLDNIYPHIKFPVSQGTPMLAQLVEWKHSEDWYVTSHKAQEVMNSGERTVRMSIVDKDNEYMAGHVIDGRNLYPATGYLFMVWETLGLMLGEHYTELSVVFENVRFQRATNIPKEGSIEFIVMIQKGSGHFEIVESGAPIVSGRIYHKKNVGKEFRVLPAASEANGRNVKHLTTKDFYKELRLRGYQYRGLFRGIIHCNVEGTQGRLAWNNNWVTFMDCMLQLKLISADTRGLSVPIRIERVSIDANMHCDVISAVNTDSTFQSFEVRVYPEFDVVRAGGVEIYGLHATPISRRNPLHVPVLEKNIFVPNYSKSEMKIEDILRANIQLILENIQTYKVKTLEVIDEEYKINNYEPVMEIVSDVLKDLTFIQPDLTVFSEDPIKMPSNITVENKKVLGEGNTVIYIGANILRRPQVLKSALGRLQDKCFIISRENNRIDPKNFADTLDIITLHDTGIEYIVLFRKRVSARTSKFIKIVTSDDTFTWIDKVKEKLKAGQKFVIYNKNEPFNGLLGLLNCLRREHGGEVVYGLLIGDPSAPPFKPDLVFYKEQLDKELAVNVYQDGQWGTYRHILLEDQDKVNVHHAFVNTTTIGDLSTLKWLEGPIRKNTVFKDPHILINVHCAALNFRDVMTAMGRLSVEAIARGRLAQEYVQGIEIVGRTCNGTRVMAMVRNRGISNLVEVDKSLMWSIPDEWTYEEAASVPIAYVTVYYAMVMVGQLQRGESLLIHAGSGGVGQAAINVALHYGCEIFTTVGTPEKRAFIKKLFPKLKDSHIGNSRDTSFEDMIRIETKGKGVDMVLNSLSDEKLQASTRCLGFHGRFLEIGKFDIGNNTPIGMHFFQKETAFNSIMLDYVFDQNYEFKKCLQNLLLSGIDSGAVRPLTYCTFKKNEVQAAFRYMATGKHIGKVIIKIRDDQDSNRPIKPVPIKISAVPRYMCTDNNVYVLVGGLGGFGMELADWLILRGARNVLLSSRRGISNGYQASRLRSWAQYNANVQISTHDVTTEDGCKKMLEMAAHMGKVEAIFNLAVVLKDSLFQNQNPETFKASFAPKALTTMHLDKLSRKLCPDLKDFVIFSSVTCGRGNVAQTNYGFSNSVMERICEWRHKLGLPALAVQWGAIGEVGVVADMQDEDIELGNGGTLQQSISSCLQSLEKFLKQDEVVVSSIVVAEKKASGVGYGNIVDTVANIMGFKDLKTVSKQVSLAELGMDSMMAVEIKQTLERLFEIFLTSQDIYTLTFERLIELTAIREAAAARATAARPLIADGTIDLRTLDRNFGEENLAIEPFIYMPTMVSDGSKTDVSILENVPIMFIVPGIKDCAAAMAPLCERLKVKVCLLQLVSEYENDTLDTLVHRLYQIIKPQLLHDKPFILLGYSFGCLPMLKLASILESEGHAGTIFCVDGSPDYLQTLLTAIFDVKNDNILQNSLICRIVNIIAPKNDLAAALMEKLLEIESHEEKINYAIKVCPVQINYSKKFIANTFTVYFDRFKMILNHTESDIKKLKSPIVLLRPKEQLQQLVIKDNYGLDKVTEGTVTVHYLEGNHATIIENKNCANIINQVLTSSSGNAKESCTKCVYEHGIENKNSRS